MGLLMESMDRGHKQPFELFKKNMACRSMDWLVPHTQQELFDVVRLLIKVEALAGH